METDNNDQIFDVIISTNKETNLNVDFKFVYSTYSVDEKLVDDNKVYDSGSPKKNRYIEINTTNPSVQINSSVSLLPDEISLQSKLESYNNRNIQVDNDIFFNKVENYDNKKAFYYNETNTDKEEINCFYSLEEEESSLFSFAQNNSKSIVLKENLEGILLQENNHKFTSRNEISILSDYSKLIKKDLSTRSVNQEVFNGNLLGDFRKLLTSRVDDDFVSPGVTKIGFYLTKFRKDMNGYEKKANFFKMESSGLSNQTYNFNVKDEAIVYGETYRYALREVYLYRRQSTVSNFIDYYIVCGYPFFSKDIICKEFKDPQPPIALSCEYVQKRKLFSLYWEAPSNDQNDVKGYQILKRNNLNEPYTVIGQIESHLEQEVFERKENVNRDVIIKTPGILRNNFIDKDYDSNKMQIYTVRSIDAHGNLSKYSNQIAVLYNMLENNLTIDSISKPGAPIDMPNLLIKRRTIFFDNEEFSITNLPVCNNLKKVTLYVTPDFVKITNNEFEFDVIKEKYKFTMTKLNNLAKEESIVNIKNFEARFFQD
jgi:hypothetical protein